MLSPSAIPEKSGEEMRVVILIDNTPNPHTDLQTEHGLSIYFEVDNRKWLMDVGASGKFEDNAARLGISIADIDCLVLSHAHRDHTGGLANFIKQNSKAKIFISTHIAGNYYYSTRRGSKRDISPDYSIVENNPERFVLVDTDIRLSESVMLHCNIPVLFGTPKANRTLLVNDLPDDFLHEMALCIDTPQGDIVLSACTHLGILNTLSACQCQDLYAYIGGTHLIDSDAENKYETDEQLTEIAYKIKSLYPQMKLITGHCTGINAQKILSETLGEKFISFYSGFIIEI